MSGACICISGETLCRVHVAEHVLSGRHDHEPADQVVHMDIKPANILVDDIDCRVAKLADLGVSRYLVEGSLDTITSCGVLMLWVGVCTCVYRAPGITGICKVSEAHQR